MTDSEPDPSAVRIDPYLGVDIAGRYRVLSKVGGGGMGAVYAAEHRLLGKRVAVKVLHPQYAYDTDVVNRFFGEARAAALLQHRNIIGCHDVGTHTDGSPFLVIDLLEGTSLADELERCGRMDPERAIPIALQICSALAVAHERGIVHRDMKPDNVFLVHEAGVADHVKILDFGISKFSSGGVGGTRTGSMMGTPQYMSPEQMGDSSRVDGRADVYSVGVMLYEMFAGRPPFEAETLPGLIMKVVSESPVDLATLRPDLPRDLAMAVGRAMAKRPEDRTSSMADLAASIAPYARGVLMASVASMASIPLAASIAPTLHAAAASTSGYAAPGAPFADAVAGAGAGVPPATAPTGPLPKSSASRGWLALLSGAAALAAVASGVGYVMRAASSAPLPARLTAAVLPVVAPPTGPGGDRYGCAATLAAVADAVLATGAPLPAEARFVGVGPEVCVVTPPGTSDAVRTQLSTALGRWGPLAAWPTLGVASARRATLSGWSALRRFTSRDAEYIASLPAGTSALVFDGSTRDTGDLAIVAERGFRYVSAGAGMIGFVPVRKVDDDTGCIPSREALRRSAGPFEAVESELVGTLAGARLPDRMATFVERSRATGRSRVTVHRLDASCVPSRIDSRVVEGWVGDLQLVAATSPGAVAAATGPTLLFVASHMGAVEAPGGIEQWDVSVLGNPAFVFSRAIPTGRVPSGQRRIDIATAVTTGPNGLHGYWPMRLMPARSSPEFYVWNGVALVLAM